MLRRICFLVLWVAALVTLPPPLSGQPADDIRFRRLGLEEGLSQSSVNCILRDHQGFMWFGTQDGLNRFDGYTFTVYRHDERDSTSIADNYINCIIEDANGDLWIGTYNGGVDRYDRVRDNFIHFSSDPADSSTLSGKNIQCLLEDPSGGIWAGAWGFGLNKLNRATGNWRRLKPLPSDSTSIASVWINSLAADRKGKIWISTWVGLDCLDTTTYRCMHYRHSDDPNSISDNRLVSVFVDRGDRVWAGAIETGLNRLDQDRRKFTRYGKHERSGNRLSSDWVGPIVQDNAGILWIGTRDAGILRLDPSLGEVGVLRNVDGDETSLSGNFVCGLLSEADGNIWVGVLGGGINHYDPKRYKFRHLRALRGNPQSLSSPNIRALCEDREGVLWIGTFGGGLDSYDARTNTFRHHRPHAKEGERVSSNLIMAILRENERRFWIGTSGGGLHLLDPTTNRSQRVPLDRDDMPVGGSNYVMALCKGRDGTIWVGTVGAGVVRLNPSTFRYSRYVRRSAAEGLTGSFIYSIQEDRSGRLWFGTWGAGISVLDPGTGRWRAYQHKPGDEQSLSHNTILDICETSDGTIWIATEGGGLCRFDSARSVFERFKESDGLPNNTVYGILEDSTGRLWVSTNRGISCFDPARRTFRNFSMGDGLQSLEFNQGAFCEGGKGRMAFGGINGVNLFYPSRMIADSSVGPMRITHVKILDRVVKPGPTLTGGLDLAYDENTVSFEFALLDYKVPKENDYRYKLDGVDREWMPAGGRRYVSYANLGSGEYTFHVEGENSDGVWNPTGAAAAFRIRPPFWEALWFRSTAVLAVVAIGFVFYGNHLRRLEKEKAVQAEFSIRLNESQERERKRIAGELHDGLGQELLTIKNSLARCESSVKPGSDLVREIGGLTDAVQRTIQSVREISADLHPHMLDRLGLTRTLEATLRRCADASGMTIRSNLESIDGVFRPPEEINIYRIVQEGVNNVLKHSHASECTVSIRRDGTYCEIGIDDDGCGFVAAREALPAVGGFGLSNMAERVRLLKGRMTVTSTPGKGTKLRFRIPIPEREV